MSLWLELCTIIFVVYAEVLYEDMCLKYDYVEEALKVKSALNMIMHT